MKNPGRESWLRKYNCSKPNSIDSIPEMGKFLTKEQKKELLSELRLEKDPKYADCIRVILLLDKGKTVTDISRFLFLNESTVRNYKRKYKEGGLEGLIIYNHTSQPDYLS